jgi:hypothetical protein
LAGKATLDSSHQIHSSPQKNLDRERPEFIQIRFQKTKADGQGAKNKDKLVNQVSASRSIESE